MAAPSLQITAASPDPALLDLPWDVPLEAWPADVVAALPRGISRHIVRFARMSGRVVAVKEIGESVAFREYELLRQLRRLDVPSVRWSPSTCSSRCPTAPCSASRCSRTRRRG